MGCRRYTLAFFIVALLLLLFIPVQALTEVSGFSTVPVSGEDAATVLESVHVLSLAKEPVKRSMIACFDVSEEELIAIGCGSTGYRTVCVYTKEGAFLYGYGFETAGSFHVELKGEILNIYLVRSDISIGIDREGNILHVLKIEDTKENSAYWRYLDSTERRVGESAYALENNIAGSYARLIVTEKTGSKVIYEGDTAGATSKVVLTIGFAAIVILYVGVLFFQSVRRKGGQNKREEEVSESVMRKESE